ncbi:MAG TPA: tRNA (adenosine(37)-N6)-threonylcarbamoyltransferase complex transferase subunit TsaD [Chitinophagales bacterium]|nr:tRNA (adenosine(37)-N6)-threonylcarbamoyltransferase complex transferase subunit TsaD [Chitinophagales bacterium]
MQTKDNICILAIESSCDDTSAAICINGKVLANVSASQKIHAEYGGVVPELASRAHISNIVPVVDAALKRAEKELADLDAVAFTRGPGLLGSLLVGVSFAKGIAQSLDIPVIDVHHMKAHVMAHFIDEPRPSFPFLCLTVSGGHTQIVKVTDYNEMEVLGQSIDDAAGEAFDKTAKMLGLSYPGGPLIDQYAAKGNPKAFKFSKPNVKGLNYSFSGLKTSVLYQLRDQTKKNPKFIEENLYDICASIQYTIVSILLKTLRKASEETGIKEIAIAGGVSANKGLRQALGEMGEANGWKVYVPAFEYCTDNAGMVAMSAYYKYLKGEFAPLDIPATARWIM